jgi:hypothetical protein
MRLTVPYPRLRLALALLAASVIGACHGTSPFEVLGPTAGTFSIKVGQEIDIHMQNAGPGYFVVPPTLSDSALTFLEETTPGQPVPAGITQLFHFKGVASGTTIITFQNTGGFSPLTIVDTVNVR